MIDNTHKTVQELREELEKIRAERAGRGRVRSKVSRVKRKVTIQKKVKNGKNQEADDNAIWV